MAQPPQGIQSHQCCGAVAGATSQASSNGDALLQMNRRSQFTETGTVPEQLGRLDDQVVIADTEGGVIASEAELSIGGVLKAQAIRQVDALHHHGQLVETVRPQPQDLKVQIDFGRGRHRDHGGCSVAPIQTPGQGDPGVGSEFLRALLQAET